MTNKLTDLLMHFNITQIAVVVVFVPGLNTPRVTHIGWEDCVCACFQLPRHIGRHTPTSGDFSSVSRRWKLLCKELIIAVDNPHKTNICITTFWCSPILLRLESCKTKALPKGHVSVWFVSVCIDWSHPWNFHYQIVRYHFCSILFVQVFL